MILMLLLPGDMLSGIKRKSPLMAIFLIPRKGRLLHSLYSQISFQNGHLAPKGTQRIEVIF